LNFLRHSDRERGKEKQRNKEDPEIRSSLHRFFLPNAFCLSLIDVLDFVRDHYSSNFRRESAQSF